VISGLLEFALLGYLTDVVLLPAATARVAKQYAHSRGKPLLNVGCGTSRSSLRVALLGPTMWGDVNCDLAAKSACRVGSKAPCHCDLNQRLPWPDKRFGAVIASHVLEHLPRPQFSLRELRRVADRVFVVVPKWYWPHTWLHPSHYWLVTQSGKLQQMRLPNK